MKIIDKLRAAKSAGTAFHSLEFFPAKTDAGLENLYARVERLGRLHPLFIDVTWGAGGSTAELTMDICMHTQNVCGLDTMMHLTCTNMGRDALAAVLDRARAEGIQNLMALRGDPPLGQDRWRAADEGFSHAIDLVRFARERHGDWFSIGVAGYPHGHDEAPSLDVDIGFLREKVDAGADFVVTQLFYDARSYLAYVEKCRAAGITCPILPGIMPIHNYRSFRKVTELCPDVPAEVRAHLDEIQHDDELVLAYGVDVVASLCRELLDGGAPGIHFYTLNLESAVTSLLHDLHLVPGTVVRDRPWRRSAHARRSAEEDVRPIFWANRPHSYLARTATWDAFPNGRWGDSRSPAFGDLSEHHWFHKVLPAQRRLAAWGAEPRTVDDLTQVFVRYCRDEIPATPWSYRPLALESDLIRDRLARINAGGLYTINSQPRVDGAPSEDTAVGWGSPGGFVYQKAYVEFFLDKARLPALLELLARHPNLTFHAIDADGHSHTNSRGVVAVTWGVFPGTEVLQPTVVDPATFTVWKDEAFGLWSSMWASLYPEGSPSRALVEGMRERLVLVNLVDNDYRAGDLWAVLDAFVSSGAASTRA